MDRNDVLSVVMPGSTFSRRKGCARAGQTTIEDGSSFTMQNIMVTGGAGFIGSTSFATC